MSASEWRSVDGCMQRTIISRSYPPLTSGDCATPSRCVVNCDFCAVEVLNLHCSHQSVHFSDSAVSNWLALAVSEAADNVVSCEVQIDTAHTWFDRRLEQCLLSMCVGDTAQLMLNIDTKAISAGISENASDNICVSCQVRVVSAHGGSCWTQQSPAAVLKWCEQRSACAGQLFKMCRVKDALFIYRQCIRLLLYAYTRIKFSAPEPNVEDGDAGINEQDAVTMGQLEQKLVCFRANVSACHMGLARHDLTVAATSRVLQDVPDHVKCIYRRAAARLQLNMLPEASDDIDKLRQLLPDDNLADQLSNQLKHRQLRADKHTAGFMRKYLSS